jgi:hypothetical protein
LPLDEWIGDFEICSEGLGPECKVETPTLGTQQHLAKDGLPLDRAAGLKEACEAYINMFQMLFDAGVFERRIGAGNALTAGQPKVLRATN